VKFNKTKTGMLKLPKKGISETTETCDHIKSTRIQATSHLTPNYLANSENSDHAGK
jgi:hypothetical protein